MHRAYLAIARHVRSGSFSYQVQQALEANVDFDVSLLYPAAVPLSHKFLIHHHVKEIKLRAPELTGVMHLLRLSVVHFQHMFL